MSPDTLASILADTPYPGCVVTRSGAAVRLDFNGLTLRYHADGWHFGEQILESTLSEYSAPEHVEDEIYRVLKVAFGLKVQHALSEAEADRTIDPVEYLIDLCAEKMRQRLSHASITRECKEEIGRLSAERDTLKAHTTIAEARISGLESEIEATHKVLDGANVTWSAGLESGRLPLVKRAALAVEPGALTNTERGAMAARIAELERDLAAKDKSLTTANAALTRICEVIGAPVPASPEDAVEAVTTLLCTSEGHNLRADRAEETLAEIATVLDRYDIPTHYDDASHPCADGQPITLVDRVHLGMTILNDGLIGAVARLRNAEQFLACRDDELRDANDALDAIGAPRGAGKRDRLLDVASRIRASLSR